MKYIGEYTKIFSYTSSHSGLSPLHPHQRLTEKRKSVDLEKLLLKKIYVFLHFMRYFVTVVPYHRSNLKYKLLLSCSRDKAVGK